MLQILLEKFFAANLIPNFNLWTEIPQTIRGLRAESPSGCFFPARNSIFIVGQQNCRRKNGSRAFGCRIGSDIVGYSCRAVLHNAVFRILCVEIRKPKIIRMAAVLYPLALFLMAYAGSAAELFAALAVFGVLQI